MDREMTLAWEINEAIADAAERGVNESRELTACILSAPKVKRLLPGYTRRPWLDRLIGAVAMYAVSGVVVSTSMAVNTNGPCPWWLWPYWAATWLFQIFPVIIEGLHH